MTYKRPRYHFRVSHTVTIERTWFLEAEDEATAIAMADVLATSPHDETQIDDTEFEAQQVDSK